MKKLTSWIRALIKTIVSVGFWCWLIYYFSSNIEDKTPIFIVIFLFILIAIIIVFPAELRINMGRQEFIENKFNIHERIPGYFYCENLNPETIDSSVPLTEFCVIFFHNKAFHVFRCEKELLDLKTNKTEKKLIALLLEKKTTIYPASIKSIDFKLNSITPTHKAKAAILNFILKLRKMNNPLFKLGGVKVAHLDAAVLLRVANGDKEQTVVFGITDKLASTLYTIDWVDIITEIPPLDAQIVKVGTKTYALVDKLLNPEEVFDPQIRAEKLAYRLREIVRIQSTI